MPPKRNYNGSYTVQERLLPQHHEILDLALSGTPISEMARRLSMSARQLYNITNSPTFQHQLALRRDRINSQVEESVVRNEDAVAEIFKQQTLDAAKRLGELLSSPSDSVARQAANDILDRGGYPKITRSINDNNSTTLIIDSEQTAIINATLQELSEGEASS